MGDLTTFEQGDIVRTINHGRGSEGGAETTVRPLGIKSYEAHSAGYTVQVTFEVSTPERVIELQVAANGTEGKNGREWFVNRTGTAPLRLLEDRPLNTRVMELKATSNAFVSEWVQLLSEGAVQEAYLRTLSPDRLAGVHAEYGGRLFASTLAPDFPPARSLPAGAPGVARWLYLPGYRDFTYGGLVQAGPGFWAQGTALEEVPAQARKTFRQPRDYVGPAIALDRSTMPLWERKENRVRFYHTFQWNLFHRYIAQGALVAETDARALEETGVSPTWRLASIELYNGRTMSPFPHP
jgi:hypothetical protein